MKYAVLGDEDTVLGFGMVGVLGKTVSNSDEADQGFRAILKDKNVGIIIITELVADMIRPVVDKYLFAEIFPLIVEIPDGNGRIEGRAGIRDVVNSAIGIKL